MHMIKYWSIDRGLALLLYSIIMFSHMKECTGNIRHGKLGLPVTLTCDSCGELSNFQFWQTPMGIIAPGHNVIRAQFKYDILNGELKILILRLEEDGQYYCYSKGISNGRVNVSIVTLLIDENNEIFSGSYFVAGVHYCIVLLSGAIVILIVWTGYIFKIQNDHKFTLDDLEPIDAIDEDIELSPLHSMDD